MKKYRVYGTTTVTVTKEVWASSEDEALEKAYGQLSCLTAYCGNGSYDKLIGVEEDNEAVETFDDIEYNDADELEDDPDYFECPDCWVECNMGTDDNGNKCTKHIVSLFYAHSIHNTNCFNKFKYKNSPHQRCTHRTVFQYIAIFRVFFISTNTDYIRAH